MNQKHLTKSKNYICPLISSHHILLPSSPTTLGCQGLLILYLDYCNHPWVPCFQHVLNTGYPFQGMVLLTPFSSKSSNSSPLTCWHPRQTMSWPHSLFSTSLPHFPYMPTKHDSPCVTYSLLFLASQHSLKVISPGHSCLVSNCLFSKFPYPSRVSPITTLCSLP